MLPHTEVKWEEWEEWLAGARSFPEFAKEVRRMMADVAVTPFELDTAMERHTNRLDKTVESHFLANRDDARASLRLLESKISDLSASVMHSHDNAVALMKASDEAVEAKWDSRASELEAMFHKNRAEGRLRVVTLTVAITGTIMTLAGLLLRYVPWSTLF